MFVNHKYEKGLIFRIHKELENCKGQNVVKADRSFCQEFRCGRRNEKVAAPGHFQGDGRGLFLVMVVITGISPCVRAQRAAHPRTSWPGIPWWSSGSECACHIKLIHRNPLHFYTLTMKNQRN